MPAASHTKKIKEMLLKGEIYYLDSKSGYNSSIKANCPKGHSSSISRVEKEKGAINRVVFRCAICDESFEVKIEDMILI